MLLTQLFEQAGKTAAVTFGRLNPPTIGHQKLVDAVLKQKADAHFLFVSQTEMTKGKNKTRLSNPLPFDVKLGFIQQAFPNINIGDTSVSTAIGMLQFLETKGFDNVIFVGGSDRVAAFTELFNKQNGVDYNLKSIQVVSSGDRDPDADGAEGMSASKMRAAAIANDFESFKTGLPVGLQGNAEEVFSAVRQGLEPWLDVKQDVEEDWGKALTTGLTAASIAAGGTMGWYNWTKFNNEVTHLEKVKSELVVRDPAKAVSLQKAIDRIKATKGNAKLNATTRRNIDAAKKLIGESITEAPIEMDPSEPMNPTIYGAGANPGKLKYRMMRAAGQFKDLAARVDTASPSEWQTMIKQFEELKMNVEQIRHGLEELAKLRRKGGVRSRGIDPNIESVQEGYGRYWCSTDKKWKTRQGPKQTRKSK